MPLKAVIFDFDGVIADTEPIHYRAFQEVARREGLSCTWEEYLELYIGYDDRDLFRHAFRRERRDLNERRTIELVEKKAREFRRMLNLHGAKPFPGSVELIRAAAAAMPIGLCSGALRGDVDPVLSLLGVDSLFSAVVTAEDVHVSKPDPASYRLCVDLLATAFPGRDIVPASCVAVEDTPAGIAAARGAGLKVLAVATSHRLDQLSSAHRAVESLGNVSLDDVRALA